MLKKRQPRLQLIKDVRSDGRWLCFHHMNRKQIELNDARYNGTVDKIMRNTINKIHNVARHNSFQKQSEFSRSTKQLTDDLRHFSVIAYLCVSVAAVFNPPCCAQSVAAPCVVQK